MDDQYLSTTTQIRMRSNILEKVYRPGFMRTRQHERREALSKLGASMLGCGGFCECGIFPRSGLRQSPILQGTTSVESTIPAINSLRDQHG